MKFVYLRSPAALWMLLVVTAVGAALAAGCGRRNNSASKSPEVSKNQSVAQPPEAPKPKPNARLIPPGPAPAPPSRAKRPARASQEPMQVASVPRGPAPQPPDPALVDKYCVTCH